MMTVKEVVNSMDSAKKITIFLGDEGVVLEKDNDFMMDAFGRYAVKYIRNGFDHDEFDIHIAVQGKLIGERAGA